MGGRLTSALRISPRGTSWPSELDRIEAPPDALWLKGRVDWIGVRPRVGIVGTRSPTPYGEAQAERFGRALAAAGFAVVSGLARGVDQAAHGGALDVGGCTIAVLGSGVERPWPRDRMAQRVVDEGLVLSEYEPEVAPRRHHFPMRNRLLAGLCVGVVVIEAAARSGSLITAHWAADQGRSVWALPGRVDHPMSRGAPRLIREGAALVEDPEEVIAEVLGVPSPRSSEVGGGTAAGPEADALEQALLGETLTADDLAQRLDRPLADVLARLVQLELDGRVARAPGGLYRRR